MSSKKYPETLKVTFTPLAEKRLIKLLEYLEAEWSRKTRDKVLAKILVDIKRVSQYPISCPESKIKKGLHQCVVSKQTSFYYRVKTAKSSSEAKSELEIISIFDNRQKVKNRR